MTFVAHTAAIYFDFNAPVITNTVSTLIDNTVSIQENIEAHAILIYPNPVTSTFNIHFRDVERGKFEVILLDLNQRVIYKKNEYSLAGENHFELPASHLPKGIYVLQIQSAGSMTRKKIVKL